ncbi:MAG TPA: DUF3325 domain-containing protein [Steroidobacter sp.]|nr:DUF3325 domain-containing protein [Steroidobacter sp.]
MIFVSLMLCFCGFIALSLAMNRHYQQVAGQPLERSTQVALRVAGSVLLAAGMFICIGGWGTSVGIALWCGVLSMAALLQVLLLTYRPTLLTSVARTLQRRASSTS